MGQVFEGALKTFIPFAQKGLSNGQIDLRMFDADMAHVGGEDGKLVQDIVAFLVPLVKPMDGEGVAQVMEARPRDAGFCEAAAATDVVEKRQDIGVGERAVGVTEERGMARGPGKGFLTKGEIGIEFGGQGG